LLPVIIEEGLPSFVDYLDSRLQQTSQIVKLKKGCIRVSNTTGISVAPFWLLPRDMQKILQPAPIEQEIRLEFVDIPNIHCYDSEMGDNFFAALAGTDEMEIFEKKAIKRVIELKWPLTREYTIKRLFFPFVLFLSYYLIYMNWIFYMREESNTWMWINYGSQFILLLLSYYFISLEAEQLKNEGINYLKSIWNYLDLCPPILLFVFIPLAILGVFDNRGAPTLEASL